MTIIANLRGTSEEHFRIRVTGPTIYTGTDDPNVTPPAPIDVISGGDIYLRQNGADGFPWVYNAALSVWEQFSVGNSISRTIAFNDAPDSGTSYDIGVVPPGHSVARVHLEVDTAFDDAVADDVQITRPAVPATTLMETSMSDIKLAGNYYNVYPPAGTPVEGTIVAEFNADPNGSGGTQGSVTVTVEYIKL